LGRAKAGVIVLARAHQDRLVGRRLRLACASLACMLMTLAGTTTKGHAQAAGGGLQIFNSAPEPVAATLGQTSPFGGDARPTTVDGKYALFGWLFSAGLNFGGKYDSNVNATPINQQSVYGANFQPTLIAEHNTGIQNTQLYLNGDISYYPSIGRTYLDGTRAGFIHTWEIQRDLIFRFQTQVAEVQAGSSFNNFLTAGIYATTPVNYTQIYGSSSIQKEFGSFFTAVGGSITGTKYQNATDNFGNVINEQFQNGTVSTVNTRLGYRISAFFYTYVEPSYNWTNYQQSSLDSHGYRVVGGIGSGLISLFSGEIYGGYLRQMFEDQTTGVVTSPVGAVSSSVGTVSSPVVGGRLSWFPTRFLTFAFSADENFGTTDSNALAFTPGSPTKLTTVKMNVNWDFSYWYALTAGIGDQRQDYLNISRKDDFLAYNAGIVFKLRPGFGLQLGYTHQHLYSTIPGIAYSRDLVTVSGNTKF
jgi:hypothetical protein